MLTIVFMAVFSATALGGSPPSPTVSVIGDIGGPGQDPASVDVGFDAQTGHVSGGWDYFDRGQQFSAIATCLRYRVLASSVYDVVITAIKTYPGASEYVVLEVIDDDSPGGVDAARMSFQSNGGIKAGATPNCWAPVLTPVPLASNTIYVTGLATASTSPAPTVTVTRTMGGALSLPASVNVRLDGQTGQLSGEFNFYDEGQNHLATPTCLKYRVLAPSVYDVVITATANYAGEPPQHVVLEAIDNDSPGGTDAARVSFQRNDSVQQGTTPIAGCPSLGLSRSRRMR